MVHSVIEDRGRVLENAFFAHQDDMLLKRLREADRIASRKQALAAASGVTDDAVLAHWVDLDLSPQALVALALVPLVLVAWADGALDASEKAALRDAAHATGLDRQPEAAALLDGWLAAPPGTQMAEAWREYIRALAPTMTAEARAALRQETLGRARRVAEAAGGFLGLGSKVSEAEHRVLAGLEHAFRD